MLITAEPSPAPGTTEQASCRGAMQAERAESSDSAVFLGPLGGNGADCSTSTGEGDDPLGGTRRCFTSSTGSLNLLRPVPSLPCLTTEDPEYQAWRAHHPCILQRFDAFLDIVRGKRLAVFLDYDGTLTPIVNHPDLAFMSEQMRDVVRTVAQHFPTAVISGRGREKVEDFVQLPELFYAGSHGLDIAGPSSDLPGDAEHIGAHLYQPAAEFAPVMDRIYRDLCERLSAIPGASVEHNKFCVSAHFRNCAPDQWEPVVAAVDAAVACASAERLRVTRGRKVLEVRPHLAWDKGRALLHLLEALGLRGGGGGGGDGAAAGNGAAAGAPEVVPLYMGDDKTDEDAFQAMAEAGQGVGILVSSVAKPTLAGFTVRDPLEVQAFLARLVSEYGGSDADGWVASPGACVGWAPQRARAGGAAAAATTATAAEEGL